jgi:transposase
MEKELLEECLGEGLSLEAIGKRVGKHESTVSYWLKKHGLVAAKAEKHAARGELKKETLEELLAADMSLREIAARVDRSLATVRYWVRRYGLSVRAHRHDIPDDAGREAKLECRQHGMTQFIREGRGYYRCKRCRLERVGRRRRTIKSKLVAEAGGKCSLCGYCRCHRALQFHHLDPSTKEFHLGHGGATRSLARSRAEARKCILLCANCHAEVEAGITTVPLNSVPLANPE